MGTLKDRSRTDGCAPSRPASIRSPIPFPLASRTPKLLPPYSKVKEKQVTKKHVPSGPNDLLGQSTPVLRVGIALRFNKMREDSIRWEAGGGEGEEKEEEEGRGMRKRDMTL